MKKIDQYVLTGIIVGCLVVPVAAQLPEKVAIHPEQGAPSRLRSPGVLVGNTLYLSGQTGHDRAGSVPADFRAEVRQCLENLRHVLLAAGMDYANVVSAHVFLKEMGQYQQMNEAFRKVFGTKPPVRTTLGVGGLPGEARVMMQAIAVQDGTPRDHIAPPAHWKDTEWWPFSPAIRVNGLLYISGLGTESMVTGRQEDSFRLQVRRGLLNLSELLEAAGVGFDHVVFVAPHLAVTRDWAPLNIVYRQFFTYGDAPARATQTVKELPLGAPAEFTAVAVTDLKQRQVVRQISHPILPTASPCVFGGDILYTSGFRGFLPGRSRSRETGMPFPPGASDFDGQLRLAMRNMEECLEAAGLTLDNVVHVSAFLNDIADLDRLDRLYAEYFPGVPPARTVFQPAPDTSSESFIQFSGIAVRSVTQSATAEPKR